MNGKSARKLFSMALALLMVIGVFPAPAQAAGLTISAPGHWDPYVSAGEIVLDAGDTLTIAQTAGSPASAVKIQVNGSCTINGFPGYIDKLYIVEKINTPMDVTLNNVHISAPANTAAYQQLSGTIHLIGDNELIAGSGQNAIIGSSLAITIDSSSGGTLAVRSGKAAITATPLIVKGDAQVKLNSSSSPSASASSYQVASGAELSMEGAPMGISTTSDVNIQNDGVMTVAGANANGIYAKNLAYSGTGTLTVSGTGAGSGINLTDSTGAALTINSGTIKAIGGATGNAVTLAGTSPKIVIGSGTLEMTNNALTSETHAFTMDAAGDPWTVLGTGVTHTGDLTGLSIDVTVPSGGAGTVRRGAAAAAPLDAPAGLAWDVSATGTVKAKWNAAPNAGIYRIELYKQGSVSPEYAADEVNTVHDLSYRFKVRGSGIYTFRVKAMPAPEDSAHTASAWSADAAPYTHTAVCKITKGPGVDFHYTRLSAAITDALDAGGATITLLQHIEETAPIIVDSADIKFALGDFNLTLDTGGAAGSTALTVQNGAKVTCTGAGSGRLNVIGAACGVRVEGASEAHISGSVTAGKHGVVTVSGSGNPKVTVDGDVTVTGPDQDAVGEVEAITAGGSATVTIGGNVTANRTGEAQTVTAIYSNGSTVVVNKNVTTQGSGVTVVNDGHVTIEGMLNFNPTSSGSWYIKLASETKTADGFNPAHPRDGYKQYDNGANIVWIKGAAQLGTPTGLAWDTSGGEFRATWTAVADADQYEVKYYKNGSLLGISTTVSAPDTFTDDMTDNLLLSWGTGSYTFTVQATAAYGSGLLDSEVSQPSAPYMHGVTAYNVTVSGSYASSTGAGSYAPGSAVTVHAGNRPGYDFAGWTTDADVAIINAGSADAGFTMPSYAVAVTANWSYSGGSGGSTMVSAQITPKEAVFNRDPAHVNHRDVAVTLSGGSYSLSGILLDGKALQKDTDYTVSGGTVTIKKAYLARLGEGSHQFTFDMSGGADPILTVTVTGKASSDIPFEDVQADDWFAAGVMWAYEAGLMQGVSEKPMLFGPHGDTTRGMIVTILYRLEGSPASEGSNPFSDVAAGQWYAAAVTWAAENQIVKGYGDGRFGPEDPITREQLAAVLHRYAGFKGYDADLRTDLTLFTDGGAISDWAREAVSWAAATGLLEGDGGMLTPTDRAERCQAAAILRRFARNTAG